MTSAGDSDDQTSEPDPVEAARAEIEAFLSQIDQVPAIRTPVREIYDLGRTNDYLEQLDREQDIELKRRYAKFLLWMLGGQLAIADAVFVVYAHWGAHWKLSSSVIDVWLGATLVEVVGIVLVVTRYLFPRRDRR